MIRSMKGFSFASALDLNMGYYHIKLDADADAQKQCTIVFPWHTGKYKYKRLSYHQPIIVCTDHKNNTFNGLKASDRVLLWLLLLEEYGVTFEYPPGKKKKNLCTVKDALSCLDTDSLNIQEEIEEVIKFYQDQKATASVISN
jgi:hypothetical protein